MRGAATGDLVSTVIPTYNRRGLLPRAIDSALAQTWKDQEIIVVDDGSNDGTAEMLAQRYGEKVRCIRQPNGGVSSARNTGMAAASGKFIALLDSDDVWLPAKLEKQVALLRSRPDLGMVLCDVQRVDRDLQPTDILRRREAIPNDGQVLEHVLMMPSLVPASVLMRREVPDQVGGFDLTLRTAEDIDFHLRVASRFGIGVIDEPLVLAMRGHEGLSAHGDTQSDYVLVMERFVRANSGRIPSHVARRALFLAYLRNSRSAFISARTGAGVRFMARAVSRARRAREFGDLVALMALAARTGLARALRALAGRGS